MFIGREKEIKRIKENISQNGKTILLYGKRRIGKTTLILKAVKECDKPYVYFECLKTSLKENLNEITRQFSRQGIIPEGLSFSSFSSLFGFINNIDKQINVVIDEYPYLKTFEKSEYVDSIFQEIIDNHLKNINLIISGSHIGMMKMLLHENNALFGRFNDIISLQSFDYYEASLFFPNKAPYEKVALYAVFGGSPFILSQLDYNRSLKENIKATFLNKNSAISLYISELITSDLQMKETSKRIFKCLGNSKKRYTEIENGLGLDKNGLLSKQLSVLKEMEFIDASNPINKKDDKKKTRYFIKDNSMRFFYTYIYGNNSLLDLLKEDRFYEEYIEQTITNFISYRFEDVAKEYISRCIQSNGFPGVKNVGSYYYYDIENKTNGEFDVVLEKDVGYDILEVKYLKKQVDQQLINKEISQIKLIKSIKVNKIGFIAINGFNKEVSGLDYYITGEEMYEQ